MSDDFLDVRSAQLHRLKWVETGILGLLDDIVGAGEQWERNGGTKCRRIEDLSQLKRQLDAL